MTNNKQFKYRCRYCHTKFEVQVKPKDNPKKHMTVEHNCYKGTIGIADLIAIEFMPEKKGVNK